MRDDGHRLAFRYDRKIIILDMLALGSFIASSTAKCSRKPNIPDPFVERRSGQVNEEDGSLLKCPLVGENRRMHCMPLDRPLTI